MATTFARDQLSEMTDITEITLMKTFDWDRDYGPLYRACPTAFWLAPDTSDVLPAVSGPVLLRHDVIPTPAPASTLPSATGMVGGIGLGLLAAGPIFAASTLLLTGLARNEFTQAIGLALMSVVAAPLTVPVGTILGLIPVLVGTTALAAIGRRWPEWRKPYAWTATGGAMGTAIALAVQADAPTGLALVGTSLACARLARSRVEWSDPDEG